MSMPRDESVDSGSSQFVPKLVVIMNLGSSNTIPDGIFGDLSLDIDTESSSEHTTFSMSVAIVVVIVIVEI